jgi:DNA repair protein RadA/Sms
MATSIKKAFFCQSCGYQSPKWLGKCPSCQEWNSFAEEIIEKPKAAEAWKSKSSDPRVTQAIALPEISPTPQERLLLPDEEFNRVLGGGLVYGSLILLGGEPGIGKSTLMLQIANQLKTNKVLYVSGEESDQQIKMRAERLGELNANCYILTETNLEKIFQQVTTVEPELLIIDSIQTIQTQTIDASPGSVSQIRECTADLMRFAKESKVSVILIGHITKDGQIAGPKILEHMVDVVLQFEGDRNFIYRLVRASKNRFGSTAEIGIYEMSGAGLKQVTNPSQVLISHFDEPFSGIAVSATIEGARPMLIETQALVSTAVYGTPQRSATGFDLRRLNMLLAVIEKRCGFRLGQKDVFLNITGGLRIDDPAIDLGIVCAILSSSEDIPIPSKTCFAAEVGLSGEIRSVNRIEQRIAEAEKMGFSQILISDYNLKGLDINRFKIKVHAIKKIEDAFSILFS